MTTSENTALIGALLNDRYLIHSLLGEGGMGVVYRANDTLIKREVAIKVTLNSYLSAEGRAQLVKEAQAAGSLNHPNIVTIYDIGEADGRTFIAMEFVEGHTLSAPRPHAISETVEVAKQICAALAHAHEKDIIHRDLKPENVMILPDGTLKLMDFGLARSLSSRLTEEGQMAGTVLYMPPEQALGESLDGRTDLYALGVMLYELTTGQLPFQADDPLAIITQHLYTPPVPPKAHRDDLPGFLNNLIMKLMEKDPDKRVESAGAVLELLDSPGKAEAEIHTSKEVTGLDRIVRGRIVGRQAEYEKARTLWKQAAKGRGQTVLISGEPGIGKTRLMREVVTLAEVGRGQAYNGEAYAESNTPYGPFSQIVRAVFKRNPNIAQDLSRPLLADLIKLAPTLGTEHPDIKPSPHLDPESEQALLLEHMVAFCEVLSHKSPLLIVLDDAHWADSGTLAMLHHLVRRTHDQAIMFLVTYREIELHEAQPFNELLLELNRQRIGERIKLERLNQEQTRGMLAAIFQDTITDDFLASIYRETEGNPFFIEEICRALVDSGKLHFEEREWRRPSTEELEIPQGIKVAVQSRLYKLDEQVQDALRMAAMMGREFEFDILQQALNLEEDALIDAVETAEDAQMIQEVRGRAEITFAFVHALVPQSIRESVRTLRRRKLHKAAAAAFEVRQPENFEALAYHHGEGGNDEEALRFYTLAAKRALDNFTNQDAENLLLQALDLAEDSQTRADLYHYLGRVLNRLSLNEQAVEAYRSGIAIYLELEELDKAAKIYALAVRNLSTGSVAHALALALEGMQAVERLQESPGLAHLLERSASAYIFTGKIEEGLPLAHKALEMARELNIPAVQVEALNTISIAVQREDHQKGADLIQQAVELAEQNNLWREAMRAHANYASIVGEDNRALQRKHFARSIELARMMGLTYQELSIWTSSVSWAVWMGDIRYGLQELAKIEIQLEKMADLGIKMPGVSYVEGDVLRFQGDLEKALSKYQQALEIYEETDNKLAFSDTIGATTWLLIESGQPDQLDYAYDLLERSLEIEPNQVIHLALVAQLFIKKRNHKEARNYLTKAQMAYQENPVAWDQYWVRLIEAQLLADRQEWDKAWVAIPKDHRGASIKRVPLVHGRHPQTLV